MYCLIVKRRKSSVLHFFHFEGGVPLQLLCLRGDGLLLDFSGPTQVGFQVYDVDVHEAGVYMGLGL